MKRFIIATLVGLTVAASLSTSASAFKCLAQSSNGVNTWGYGIFFRNASGYAVRHCRVAGGIDCHIAYCRNQLCPSQLVSEPSAHPQNLAG